MSTFAKLNQNVTDAQLQFQVDAVAVFTTGDNARTVADLDALLERVEDVTAALMQIREAACELRGYLRD